MTFLRTLVLSLFSLVVALSGAVILAVIGAAIYFSPGLPDVRQLQDFELHTPLRIFTNDGKLIGEFGEERRMAIDFDEIPQDMINALIAAEDASYFDHAGVDPRGLARAAVELVQSGGTIQSGGSTITMQVARNYMLTLDQTFTRKIREILLALQMEQILNKEEIFELYVNKIFLGNRAYGIAAAAETYYDKPLAELSLAETAMIAGLPKAPSAFNPLANSERSLIRRNWILFRMRELGYIDNDIYQNAVQEPVTARRHYTQAEVDAAYVAEMARQYAIERFGDDAYTGIAPSLVEAQEQTTTQGLEEELSESPEIRQTARQAAQRSQTEVEGVDGDVSNWLHLSWARPYLSPRSRGAEPSSASQIAERGDLIRVIEDDDGSLRLSQRPDAEGSLVAQDPRTGAILALQE